MKLKKYVCKCGCETMHAEHRDECHGCEWLNCDYEDNGVCDLDGFENHGKPCPKIRSECRESDCECGTCYGGGCWILNCSACGQQVEQVPGVEP